MDPVTITPLDARDPAAVDVWNTTLRDALAVGREHPWWQTDRAARTRVAAHEPGHVVRGFVARRGEGIVGAALVEQETGEPAEVTIGVRPQARRRGVGVALAAAALELLDPDVTLQCEVYDDGGVRFAQAHGLDVRHREQRLLRALPVDTAELRAERAVSEHLTFSSFVGSPAPHLAPHWDALAAQMADDVPLGGLTRPARRDADARRREDARHADEGYLLVRTLAWLDERPAGYTQILLAVDAPQIALQDDTIVDRTCRGAGVARALKIANLEHLQSLPQASATRWVQTYCAETNTAILALSAALGFRCVDIMTALEGRPGAGVVRRT